MKICEKLVEYVKKNEPGTIRYQFFLEKDVETPRVLFKETWATRATLFSISLTFSSFENEEAQKIHGQSELLGELVKAGAAGAFTKPLDLIFIKEAGGFPRDDLEWLRDRKNKLK